MTRAKQDKYFPNDFRKSSIAVHGDAATRDKSILYNCANGTILEVTKRVGQFISTIVGFTTNHLDGRSDSIARMSLR
jgi:hypothetical protein